MEVVLKGTVTFQGKEKNAGDKVNIPERSAKALVDAGLAEYVAEQPPGLTTEDGNNQGGSNLPNGDLKGQEDEVARLAKALEDQYKCDELSEAAKAIGVEFKYDAKKPEIITAAIEQGKATALLK